MKEIKTNPPIQELGNYLADLIDELFPILDYEENPDTTVWINEDELPF